MLKTGYTLCGTLVSECARCSEKRVELICDLCNKETITSVANYKLRQTERQDGKTICRECACKENAKTRIKTIPWNKGKYMEPSERKHRSFISTDGYNMVFDPNRYYESSCFRGYIKEHRLVMETFLNRRLEKGEYIHHINLNKLDNRIENLLIYKSEREHHDLHNNLNKIVYQLIEDGIIYFDKTTCEYNIKETV